MPSADFLAMNPALAAAEPPGSHGGARKGTGRPTAPRAPQRPAQALVAAPVGSSFQGRLDKAAANGWHALESPDALRYRWRQNGGAVGPWGSYEEATKWGATHKPGDV